MQFEVQPSIVPTSFRLRAMAARFRLASLFKATTLAALFAFGISIARSDPGTGSMIAGFSIVLVLALFSRIPRAAWMAQAVGFLMTAVWYWWSGTYHAVHPADRLFYFVVLAVWCSVIVAVTTLIAGVLARLASR